MSDQKKRGRPSAAEPGSTVCVWVFSRQHDALIRLAKQQETSVSQIVKRGLEKAYPGLVRVPQTKRSA